jgi:diaminohydroxyphosphoribosylaminopyrimidine deaminase/5-amino-6-(5-phosphoribosylamino)uracil reductase
VVADDPRMSVRLPGASRQPLRVVLDGHLRTPPHARLFQGAQGVWIYAGSRDAQRRAALEQAGARVIEVPGDERGRLDLAAVMQHLATEGVNEVFAETGARMAGPLLQAGVVDELLLYVAPMLLGPQARPLADLPALASLDAAPRFALHEVARIGPDLRLRLRGFK